MRFCFPLLLVLLAPLHADDLSGFSTAPDVSWQRYDPRAEGGLSPSTFSFTGDECRILVPPPTTLDEYNAAKGFARAGLVAPSDFTDSVASVDVTAWSPTTSNRYDGTNFTDGIFIGVMTRVQAPVSALTVNAYSASIIDMGPGSNANGVDRVGLLQLMLIVGEYSYYPLAGGQQFALDPSRDYRLVLVSRGNTHTARVFDLSNPAQPAAEISAQDPSAFLTSGRTGIMIVTDRPTPVDVTLDNFLAWDGTPPPLTIEPGPDPGTLAVRSPFHRALASRLQTSTDPATPWSQATPLATTRTGEQLMEVLTIEGPRRFFRRKAL